MNFRSQSHPLYFIVSTDEKVLLPVFKNFSTNLIVSVNGEQLTNPYVMGHNEKSLWALLLKTAKLENFFVGFKSFVIETFWVRKI